MALGGLWGCVSGKVDSAQSGQATAAPQPGPKGPASVSPTNGQVSPAPVGPACGYGGQGKLIHVAQDIDVCLPPTTCTAEVCPPPMGSCVGGQCVMTGGYKGIQTHPEAWVTHYCQLSTGGCDGVTQAEKVQATAQKLAALYSLPLCEGAPAASACIGIAASSPMMVGNSQNATDVRTGASVRPWGLGLSEASNVCYRLKGPGGEAVVALTDRCGGYCKCNGSDYAECGACVNAKDMAPNCPCVGTAPGVSDVCCGAGCPTVVPACDWCASNNHPHFDVDQGTFDHLCGEKAVQGSCSLSLVAAVACPLGVPWPPP